MNISKFSLCPADIRYWTRIREYIETFIRGRVPAMQGSLGPCVCSETYAAKVPPQESHKITVHERAVVMEGHERGERRGLMVTNHLGPKKG